MVIRSCLVHLYVVFMFHLVTNFLISCLGDDMKVMENDNEWHFVTLGDQVI